MKTSICHYSVHRVFSEQNWTLKQFVDYVKGQGVDGIDFHVRFLPDPDAAADAIREAMDGSGLELSGLSLSTNFNQADHAVFRAEIETAKGWLKVAGAAKAPASRVFGGRLSAVERSNPDELKAAMDRVVEALTELAPVAADNGVTLALENHGGLPCTGEQQAAVIEAVDNPNCRATIDVGNYMAWPQDPCEGTAQAAKYCAYVHVKDNRRLADGKLAPTVIGEGDVDIPGCLKIVSDTGYDGFVGLEYEGTKDELLGVPKSVAYMKKALSEL